jgi:hypothetical protein
MDASTIVADGPPAETLGLPAVLRARPEDDACAERAARLAARLAVYARSPLIEPRFLEGVRGLALALKGLAVMRANDFAAPAVEELSARLVEVLSAAEERGEAVMPALAGARGSRRPRTRRTEAASGDAAAAPGPRRDIP